MWYVGANCWTDVRMCDISLRMGINSLGMEAVDHLDAFSGPITDFSVPHIHFASPSVVMVVKIDWRKSIFFISRPPLKLALFLDLQIGTVEAVIFQPVVPAVQQQLTGWKQRRGLFTRMATKLLCLYADFKSQTTANSLCFSWVEAAGSCRAPLWLKSLQKQSLFFFLMISI